MHTPNMISDLAIMLLTAGIITIIFKRIKQPLILGYILAGFLIGPFFPQFFNVEDMTSINLWSEIGVIILMFYIGLEFNLHKLARMGETAIISAVIKMAGVMAVGYGLGILMGFSPMNSIFLGGMLSISSTAVIQKSFEELGIKKAKYSQLVMGTLVIEDIVGIFMMVVLSTIAVSQGASGSALAIKLLLMICYLIVWLILGIFILPTFLNKVINLMNEEMLLVLSLGLCFGMVLIANALGFSSELGAFLAGSLLAGTLHVEKIEKVTKSIKDMFSAIFFLSVGMLVDPAVIKEYPLMILIITVVAVLAKLIFATLGMVLSGQALANAVKSGFSLAPIGEFSFIIASLGISLGVMEAHLYPIIVCAAVITTFITPTLIKNSGRFVTYLQRIMPDKLLEIITDYTSNDQVDDEDDSDWNKFMSMYFSRVAIYGIIMVVTAMAGVNGIEPILCTLMPKIAADITTCFIVYLIMAVFIRPMLNLHNAYFTTLWLKRRANRIPLIILNGIKIIIISAIAIIPLQGFFDFNIIYLLMLVLIAVFITSRSNFVATSYLKLETRFLSNLNERTLKKEDESSGKKHSWLNEELHIITLVVPPDANYLNKSLEELAWGKIYNVYVMKIRRNMKHRILPPTKTTILPGDKLYIIGELKSIENFYTLIDTKPTKPPRTLKQFMETGYPDVENAIACCAVKINGKETFAGKTLKGSKLREKHHCIVIGIQQDSYPIIMPDPNLLIGKDDLLWIMGSNNNVGRVAADSLEENEINIIK